MTAPAPLPVVKGVLDMLVLRALSWGPMHGFEIVAWLERESGGALPVEDSALYQALYRMEGRGLVAADWGTTENNRRARYYRVTPAGAAQLRTETDRWLSFAGAVTHVLTNAPVTPDMAPNMAPNAAAP
jgi:PadR family transcriptional regulator, regulatory protein PadR